MKQKNIFGNLSRVAKSIGITMLALLLASVIFINSALAGGHRPIRQSTFGFRYGSTGKVH